ncbi:MAG TPA: hypothetical protein ENH94_10255, partial [Phycisphaerales bacterium]|nr:hypothetical protein [Phycisphaerales bacterium]
MKYINIVFCLTGILISGCAKYHDLSTTVLNEDYECGVIVPDVIKPDYRLYAEDGRLTRFITETQKGFGTTLYVKGKVYWQAYEQGNKTRKYRPYDIVRKCQKYTQNQDMQKMTFEEYIQLIKDKGLFRCSIHHQAFRNNPGIRRSGLYSSYRGLGDFKTAYKKGIISAARVDRKYQIICIDPIVLVELDIDHIAWNRLFSTSMKKMWVRRPDGNFCRYDTEKGYTYPR